MSNAYVMPDEALHGTNAEMTTYQSKLPTEELYNTGYVSPEAHPVNPFSRTPPPLPSPRPADETMSFDHWFRRYEIHNQATSELSDSLSILGSYEDAAAL